MSENWQIALVALAAATNLAVIVTCFIYWLLFKAAKQQLSQGARENAWRELLHACQHINDYIAEKHAIMSPPYAEFRSDQVIGMLIFHHLNLLFRFWISRKSLTPEEQEGFERWAREIFFPWVALNDSTFVDLQTIMTIRDLYPESFVNWITHMEGYQDLLRKHRVREKEKKEKGEGEGGRTKLSTQYS